MKSKKRRGPLPTGKGTLVGVRLQPADLNALDRWIRRHGKDLTRPEAIRQLLGTGFAVAEITRGLAENRLPHAIELAGLKIDLLLNPRDA
jgi:hypothetical protein